MKKGKHTEASVHAKFSPSKLTRIIACPGSVRLSSDIKAAESAYAKEGTMLHKVTEKCLDAQEPCVPTHLAVQYNLTADQKNAVNTLLDWVSKKRLRYSQYEFFEAVETKGTLAGFNVDGTTCDELEDVYGTLDYSMYIPELRKLICADWKFGAGIPVHPNCAQLKAYALTKIGTYANLHKYHDIELVIGQPRLFGVETPVTTHGTTSEELIEWMTKTLVPALRSATSRNPKFDAVDEACRWCPVKIRCAHRYEANSNAAKKIFGTMELKLGEVPIEDLVQLLEDFKKLKTYAGQVEKHLKARLKAGKKVPGLKMVRGRSNRIWVRPDSEIIEFLEAYGYEDTSYLTSPTLKSVPQIIKLIGNKLAKEPKFCELFSKPPGAETMVAESDEREAISYATVSEVFADFILDDDETNEYED